MLSRSVLQSHDRNPDPVERSPLEAWTWRSLSRRSDERLEAAVERGRWQGAGSTEGEQVSTKDSVEEILHVGHPAGLHAGWVV